MTPSDAAFLEIAGLSVGYRNRPVLRNLSLSPVRAGRITALVGPNAAGKSTLLRAIAGLVPAEGSVRFDGRELLALRPADRAERVGFMPQALPEGVGLTVVEAVIGTLRVLRAVNACPDRRSIRTQAVGILDRLGIVDLALCPLDRLSGGQRQLASLAQTIAHGAPVLLLDEPTSALDLRFQFEVMRIIRALAREGRVVIVVLHDLALASLWADHVVVLDAGSVHAEGAPAEAITAAMLQAVYKVRAEVRHDEAGRLQMHVTGPAGSPAAGTNGLR